MLAAFFPLLQRLHPMRSFILLALLGLAACSTPVTVSGTLPPQSITAATPVGTVTVASPGGPVSVTVPASK